MILDSIKKYHSGRYELSKIFGRNIWHNIVMIDHYDWSIDNKIICYFDDSGAYSFNMVGEVKEAEGYVLVEGRDCSGNHDLYLLSKELEINS